jgi:hypothetical protein
VRAGLGWLVCPPVSGRPRESQDLSVAGLRRELARVLALPFKDSCPESTRQSNTAHAAIDHILRPPSTTWMHCEHVGTFCQSV